MKLHRFVAANDQKAMFLVNQALGEDALIYSIKSTGNGTEVIACLPGATDKEEPKEFVKSYQQILKDVDSNNNELNRDDSIREMQSKIDMLSNKLNKISSSMMANKNQELNNAKKPSYFQRIFRKSENKSLKQPGVNYNQVTRSIKKLNLPKKNELIESKKIIGLVGPAGVGKTTTIMKLAKRHISRHGADTVGIITTDYHEITEKNLISSYKQKYNIDLEYVSNATELTIALKDMANKELILIDTHGVSQRNTQKVNELSYLFETQANNIASYYVLPCNVQELVLNDVIKSYRTRATQGCIITKLDECSSLQPIFNVLSSHDLRVEYVCNGQDINSNIFIPSVERLVELSISLNEV